MPETRLKKTRDSYQDFNQSCKYCGESFKESKELQIHILLRHRVINDQRSDN